MWLNKYLQKKSELKKSLEKLREFKRYASYVQSGVSWQDTLLSFLVSLDLRTLIFSRYLHFKQQLEFKTTQKKCSNVIEQIRITTIKGNATLVSVFVFFSLGFLG